MDSHQHMGKLGQKKAHQADATGKNNEMTWRLKHVEGNTGSQREDPGMHDL